MELSVPVATRMHQNLLRLALFSLLACTDAAAFATRAVSDVECLSLCSVRCLKPLSLCDRWDDTTPITGYPAWEGNGAFDQESYSDVDGNGLRDPGEPFQDVNLNGTFDQEFYDPSSTGYLAATDVGRIVVPAFPLSFEADPPGLSSLEAYEWNLANCNSTLFSVGHVIQIESGVVAGPTYRVLRETIALDPGAVWNESCNCVENSAFEEGPRVLILPLADPRVALAPGALSIRVAKLGAFFLEDMSGTGEISLRFYKSVKSDGEVCFGEFDAGFVQDCNEVSQVRESTWGRVKASYR